jgi:hypothetical protein
MQWQPVSKFDLWTTGTRDKHDDLECRTEAGLETDSHSIRENHGNVYAPTKLYKATDEFRNKELFAGGERAGATQPIVDCYWASGVFFKALQGFFYKFETLTYRHKFNILQKKREAG